MMGPHRQRSQLAPIDFQALKREVSVIDVLRLYGWTPVKARGGELRGPCPVHGSSSPASTIFAVCPAKNAWKCHKCQAGGNQLDLAACYFRLPPDQVVRIAVAFCRQLGRDLPRVSK